MKLIIGLYQLSAELDFSQDPPDNMEAEDFWHRGLIQTIVKIDISSNSAILHWVENTTGVLEYAPRVIHPLHWQALARRLAQSKGTHIAEMAAFAPLVQQILKYTDEGLIAVSLMA